MINRYKLIKGMIMAIIFLGVLVAMFSPLVHGENILEASDRLFNSISKGSTYYIPDLLKKTDAYKGRTFDVAIRLPDNGTASNAATLLSHAGVAIDLSQTELKASGDLGLVLEAALKDSDAMFHNRGKELAGRYGFDEKEALLTWWVTLKELKKSFDKIKWFKEAAFTAVVVKKGVEVGYNFYGIEPEKVSTKAGVLSFSMVFYVVYTMWWGFAILFMFEGIGLKMTAGKKKEI